MIHGILVERCHHFQFCYRESWAFHFNEQIDDNQIYCYALKNPAWHFSCPDWICLIAHNFLRATSKRRHEENRDCSVNSV